MLGRLVPVGGPPSSVLPTSEDCDAYTGIYNATINSTAVSGVDPPEPRFWQLAPRRESFELLSLSLIQLLHSNLRLSDGHDHQM